MIRHANRKKAPDPGHSLLGTPNSMATPYTRARTSVGAHYSGPKFRTLANSVVNGFTCMGVSLFFTVDLRARYRIDKHMVASFGIDNANNYPFWNFHPYPQRSYVAELKIDL